MFIIGAGFVTAGNHELHFNLLPIRAISHCLAGFDFMLLWYFNEVRFRKVTGPERT